MFIRCTFFLFFFPPSSFIAKLVTGSRGVVEISPETSAGNLIMRRNASKELEMKSVNVVPLEAIRSLFLSSCFRFPFSPLSIFFSFMHGFLCSSLEGEGVGRALLSALFYFYFFLFVIFVTEFLVQRLSQLFSSTTVDVVSYEHPDFFFSINWRSLIYTLFTVHHGCLGASVCLPNVSVCLQHGSFQCSHPLLWVMEKTSKGDMFGYETRPLKVSVSVVRIKETRYFIDVVFMCSFDASPCLYQKREAGFKMFTSFYGQFF